MKSTVAGTIVWQKSY